VPKLVPWSHPVASVTWKLALSPLSSGDRDKIKRLGQQIRYLRKQLRQTLCRKCREKPVGLSAPRKKKYVTDPQLSSSVLRRQ